jgi:hypothetical protein
VRIFPYHLTVPNRTNNVSVNNKKLLLEQKGNVTHKFDCFCHIFLKCLPKFQQGASKYREAMKRKTIQFGLFFSFVSEVIYRLNWNRMKAAEKLAGTWPVTNAWLTSQY